MNDMDDIQNISLIILGIPLYIIGLFGNLLNICIFTKWYRSSGSNNTAIYLLISSWANFFLILYPLLTRIIFDGFNYSKTKENMFFSCQFRYYILHTCDMISLICICLAIIDRYLITSREVRIRQMTLTKKRTKFIILFLICIFSLHNIPICIYYDVSNIGRCVIKLKIYSYYYIWILQIFLHGILPVIILSIFGILTYKQLKGNIIVEKQISRMILYLCIGILISSIPYSIQNIYFILFNDLDQPLSSFTLITRSITAILFFTHAVFSFYIFYFSTPNFRKNVKNLFQFKNQVHNIS